MSEIEIKTANSIDKLVSVDVNGRGLIGGLYEAARKHFSKPLSHLAAKALVERVKPTDVVIIATGYPLRGWVRPDIGELDGPPGAVALARAINVGLGVIPVLIAPKGQLDMIQGTCRGAGLYAVNIREARKAIVSPRVLHTAVVRDYPKDDEKAKRVAGETIKELSPVALIAVENPGMNEKGIYHSGRGVDISAWVAKTEHLFGEAKNQGILTIGIGDGGNELGMGVIKDYVKKEVPYGSKCICPCKAGIAAATETDYLLVSTASNWAAYGFAAFLGVLLENPRILHDAQVEERILNACANAGAGNISGFMEPAVDGISLQVQLSVIEILRETMQNAIARKRGEEFLPWRGELEQHSHEKTA